MSARPAAALFITGAVLLPAGAIARPPTLQRSGAIVTVHSAYRAPATGRRRTQVVYGSPMHDVPRYITLQNNGASVIVQTNPFRMTFTDAAGRNVLASVQNATAAAATTESIVPPAPGQNFEPLASPLYSPLAYVVGTSSLSAMAAGTFQGNLTAATAAGTPYVATGVSAQTHTSNSANLTLTTSEGTRTIALAIVPDQIGFRLTATFSDPTNVVETTAAFLSPPGEAFHGFGGRHTGIDQRGFAVTNYAEEECSNPVDVPNAPATVQQYANSNYLFPDGPEAAYNVSTAFVSSDGYGFLLRRSELSEYRLAVDRSDAWRVALFGATLDFSVAVGTPAAVIAAQTASTGRQIVPPAWALGAMIDRAVPVIDMSASDYYAKVQADLANFATYKPPITGYRIEGWTYLTSAQLQSVLAQLRTMGIHALYYVNDYGSGYLTPVTESQAIAGNYEVENSSGQPYYITLTNGTPTVILDFTKPATQAFWNGVIAAALDTGADGFMEDFGEQVMPDMVFANGQTGLTMHNQYVVAYHQATRNAINAYMAAHPQRQIFSFTRSGFTGSAGFETGNFPGDETPDWGGASGIQSLAPDMLNRSIGGWYGYTTDIGGYFNYTQSTTKELLLRWAAWSALTPFFRLHDDGVTGTSMPWDFDTDTATKFNTLAALHNRFVPLIQSLWQQAAARGTPIVQPLWYAFPGDPQAAVQQQEWMLGPSILVAPVVTPSVTTNSVYLPNGCWQEQNTGVVYEGHRTVTVPAPLGTLNYFFVCGSQPG